MNWSFRSLKNLLAAAVLVLAGCGEAPSEQAEAPKESGETTCQGVVTQLLDPEGRVMSNEFRCEGNCPAGDCHVESVEDEKGNRRSWCGCTEVEVEDCHLIFYTPKQGAEMVFCSGEPGCALLRDTVSTGIEGTVIELRCAVK